MLELFILCVPIILSEYEKRQKAAKIGSLYGKRATKKDIIKYFNQGKEGGVNNDFFFINKNIFDNNFEETETDIKDLIDESKKENQNHLRFAPGTPLNTLSKEDFEEDFLNTTTDRQARYKTLRYIANGGKFIWKDKGNKKGLENQLFGRTAPAERLFYKTILSTRGKTVEELAEDLSLDQDFRDIIIDTIKETPTAADAKATLETEYNNYVSEVLKSQRLPF